MTVIVPNGSEESVNALPAPIMFLSNVDSGSVSSLESACSFAEDEQDREDPKLPQCSTNLSQTPFSSNHRGRPELGTFRRAESAHSCIEGSASKIGETTSKSNQSFRLSRSQHSKGGFTRTKPTGSMLPCSSEHRAQLHSPISHAKHFTLSDHASNTRSLKRFSECSLSPKISVADTSGLRRQQKSTETSPQRQHSLLELAKAKRNRLTGSKAPRLPPRKATNDTAATEDILRAAKVSPISPCTQSSAPPRLPFRKKTNDSASNGNILRAARRMIGSKAAPRLPPRKATNDSTNKEDI